MEVEVEAERIHGGRVEAQFSSVTVRVFNR